MRTQKMQLFCECNSFDCREVIEILFREANLIKSLGQIIISNSCQVGPEPADILVKKYENYTVYRDVKNEN